MRGNRKAMNVSPIFLRNALVTALFSLAATQAAFAAPLNTAPNMPPVSIAARFSGATPIGVVVSKTGRIFMSFPRAFDQGPYCVAEIKNGKAYAYPNASLNRLSGRPQAERLVSVQGLTVDAKDRLWLLDLGIIKTNPVSFGGPKLVCVDLKTNKIVKKILFPYEIAGPNAYLNDVRVDLRLGTAGTAFISDSSEKGPNGIVVVDLATGKSRRRLNNAASVQAEPGFTPVVEGIPVLKRSKRGVPPKHDTTGVDGLTLTPDGKYLYYCPNEGHHLYRVSTQALADPDATDALVSSAVEDLGDKGFASDGIEADAAGNVYLTDYEHNAVKRRTPAGKYETVASGPLLVWPDSISFRADGVMFFTADQLNRLPKYHYGKDLRQKPILLLRQTNGSKPVMLGK